MNASENTVKSKDLSCVRFSALKNWQVRQYRQAVESQRVDLARQTGRYVGWGEAERHFARHACEYEAEKWRREYCGLICPARKNCLLALHFFQSARQGALHRAG